MVKPSFSIELEGLQGIYKCSVHNYYTQTNHNDFDWEYWILDICIIEQNYIDKNTSSETRTQKHRTSDSLPLQEILDENYNSRYIKTCQRLMTSQALNLNKSGKDLRSNILGFVKDDSFIFDLEPFHRVILCNSLMNANA
jgi:hypothetical protein